MIHKYKYPIKIALLKDSSKTVSLEGVEPYRSKSIGYSSIEAGIPVGGYWGSYEF